MDSNNNLNADELISEYKNRKQNRKDFTEQALKDAGEKIKDTDLVRKEAERQLRIEKLKELEEENARKAEKAESDRKVNDAWKKFFMKMQIPRENGEPGNAALPEDKSAVKETENEELERKKAVHEKIEKLKSEKRAKEIKQAAVAATEDKKTEENTDCDNLPPEEPAPAVLAAMEVSETEKESSEAESMNLSDEIILSGEGETSPKTRASAADGDEKKKKRKRIILDILIVVFAGVFCFSAYKLGRWIYENYNSWKVSEKASRTAHISYETVERDNGKVIAAMKGDDKNDNKVFLDLNIENLKEMNPDTVGWLRVNGTLIDVPVVQAPDNEYYLYHDFEKNYTHVGCPFLDYRNSSSGISDRHNIIYGHALRSGQMFNSLRYTTQDWWLEDPSMHYVRFTTEDAMTVWQVFSVYTVKLDGYYYIRTDFSGDEDFGGFVQDLKGLSIHDFGVDVGATDRILTLSTCALNGDDRLVVHAKLVQTAQRNAGDPIDSY